MQIISAAPASVAATTATTATAVDAVDAATVDETGRGDRVSLLEVYPKSLLSLLHLCLQEQACDPRGVSGLALFAAAPALPLVLQLTKLRRHILEQPQNAIFGYYLSVLLRVSRHVKIAPSVLLPCSFLSLSSPHSPCFHPLRAHHSAGCMCLFLSSNVIPDIS